MSVLLLTASNDGALIEPWSIICNMYIIFTPIYMYGAPILLLHIYQSHVFYGFDVTSPQAHCGHGGAAYYIISYAFVWFLTYNTILFVAQAHTHSFILLSERITLFG
jgi:hypothetical protein